MIFLSDHKHHVIFVLLYLHRRTAQAKAFDRLAAAYRQHPNDTPKLVALMQDVQDYGQPPADLVQGIAPGLQLDADGMPALSADDCRTM